MGEKLMFYAINKINIIIMFFYSFTLFSTTEYQDNTYLELNKNCILSTSKNSISFQAIASNGASYRAGLSCFIAKHPSNKYKEGEFRVLKSQYHVGAHIKFYYSECLKIKSSLQKGTGKILLSWDQEKFDDFISAKLKYQKISS
jgi:hypothetical protein